MHGHDIAPPGYFQGAAAGYGCPLFTKGKSNFGAMLPGCPPTAGGWPMRPLRIMRRPGSGCATDHYISERFIF
ncbi:MAG: hypothetical protein [Olavius algarvensis Delta 4 endosymbiont]|nr:MAG: hypothetical protein [Olavius algarvensis Delta 4 endosymbiont]